MYIFFKRLKNKKIFVHITLYSGTSIVLGVWSRPPSYEERAKEYSTFLKDYVSPEEMKNWRWTRVEEHSIQN